MASLDQVQLVNDALTRIGELPIQSFNDNTEVANAVQNTWNQSRQFLISDYPWAWAQQWAELAQIVYPGPTYANFPNGVTPGQLWMYGYQLPAGIIRLNSVWYGGTSTPASSVIGGQGNPYVTTGSTAVTGPIQFSQQSDKWEIVGSTILSNDPYVAIWYQTDILDTLQWTPQFAETMVALTAWKLAYARAKSSDLQARCEQTYKEKLKTARHNDSIGRPSQNLGQQGYSALIGIRKY